MASLYRKKNSPFWYIEFIEEGVKRNVSTKLRRDDRQQTIEAKKLLNKIEAKMLEGQRKDASIKWGKWVDDFFKRRCTSKLTLERYLNCWKWCQFFFIERKITGPAGVYYQTALDYFEWRTSYVKKTGKTVCKNTALLEVKIMALVMSEAVKLGYIPSNPINKLGISREEAEEKPALTDNEIIICQKALKEEAEWMRYAFEISLKTGCRLRETSIPLHCISLERNSITFPKPKGGKKRAFTIPIRNDLRPVIKEMVKRKYVIEFPFQPSRHWQRFFQKVGLNHLCFHCLRVTFITRLALEGVPLAAAMRLVNHGSELVHRIYIRLNVDDLLEYANLARLPSYNGANA
jgi:integrase